MRAYQQMPPTQARETATTPPGGVTRSAEPPPVVEVEYAIYRGWLTIDRRFH